MKKESFQKVETRKPLSALALERIKRLERLLGQKTEEEEILHGSVRIGGEKNLFGANPLLDQGSSQ